MRVVCMVPTLATRVWRTAKRRPLSALSLTAIVKGKLGPIPVLILSALAGCLFYL